DPTPKLLTGYLSKSLANHFIRKMVFKGCMGLQKLLKVCARAQPLFQSAKPFVPAQSRINPGKHQGLAGGHLKENAAPAFALHLEADLRSLSSQLFPTGRLVKNGIEFVKFSLGFQGHVFESVFFDLVILSVGEFKISVGI